MSAPYARQAQVALLVLLTVTFLGGWNMPTGSGTWIAQAEVMDGKDNTVDGKDNLDQKQDFDHLACYEVKCIDAFDKDGHKVTQCDTEEERVTLFNQFTDEKDKKEHDFKGFKGQKVLVGKLTFLCVPTKKVIHDDKDVQPK